MLIPKELIKKYQDIYNKDFSQFTDYDWKKYNKFLNELKKKGENEDAISTTR